MRRLAWVCLCIWVALILVTPSAVCKDLKSSRQPDYYTNFTGVYTGEWNRDAGKLGYLSHIPLLPLEGNITLNFQTYPSPLEHMKKITANLTIEVGETMSRNLMGYYMAKTGRMYIVEPQFVDRESDEYELINHSDMRSELGRSCAFELNLRAKPLSPLKDAITIPSVSLLQEATVADAMAMAEKPQRELKGSVYSMNCGFTLHAHVKQPL